MCHYYENFLSFFSYHKEHNGNATQCCTRSQFQYPVYNLVREDLVITEVFRTDNHTGYIKTIKQCVTDFECEI